MYHLRRKVHFVVMTSVFDTPAQINTIYDLKGSLIGRSATAREREGGGVLKDNDLISDGCKLHLGAKKAAFMAQLEKDAMFLAKLNIMDYSLLVGIHDRKLRGRDTLFVPGGRESSSSVPGGSAAAVNAAAATGAVVSAVPTDATTTAGGVVGSSGGSVEDGVLPPPPPVSHIHTTHSNTPFRRASALNPDLSGAVADANGLPAAHPTGSPPFTNRKKRTSTLKSEHTFVSTGGTVDPTAFRLDMSRSMSLDEDYHPPNKSNGHTVQQHGTQSSSMDTPTGTGTTGGGVGMGVMRRGSGSEVEEETEDEEEEEEGDGEEGDDEEEGSDDESEFEDIDAGDSDEEGRTTGITADSDVSSTLSPAPRVVSTLVVEDGVGALGSEGFKLAEILRADALKSEKNDRNSTNRRPSEETAPVYTYGPGQARRHPWTTRRDEGINSRTSDGKRGDEIYYLGVIDILQQYNANKRMETLIKVRPSYHFISLFDTYFLIYIFVILYRV